MGWRTRVRLTLGFYSLAKDLHSENETERPSLYLENPSKNLSRNRANQTLVFLLLGTSDFLVLHWSGDPRGRWDRLSAMPLRHRHRLPCRRSPSASPLPCLQSRRRRVLLRKWLTIEIFLALSPLKKFSGKLSVCLDLWSSFDFYFFWKLSWSLSYMEIWLLYCLIGDCSSSYLVWICIALMRWFCFGQ